MTPRIIKNSKELSSKSQKKLQSLDNEYIEELEHKVKQYKNKASNMERGPTIEGDVSELDAILPELVGQFEPYAPKWLKPFLKNSDMQKWIMDYASKNPEKVQGMIGKMIKKKSGSNGDAGSKVSEGESVITV